MQAIWKLAGQVYSYIGRDGPEVYQIYGRVGEGLLGFAHCNDGICMLIVFVVQDKEAICLMTSAFDFWTSLARKHKKRVNV